MSDNLENKLPEMEKYKKEAATYKKQIQQVAEKAQVHAHHMQARHIEGLHAFYKEKLGYTGAADLESLKQFKHNYFEHQKNQEEAVEFLGDFHVHKAILTFYEELFKEKNAKPLHELTPQEYKKRVAHAYDKAKELRTTNKHRYNLFFQDYAGIEHEAIAGLIKEYKHDFGKAYTQHIPEIAGKYANNRAMIDVHDVYKNIRQVHLDVDEELGKIVQGLTKGNRDSPYIAAPHEEQMDPRQYQHLLERDVASAQQANQAQQRAQTQQQAAPTMNTPDAGGPAQGTEPSQ